MSYKAEWTIKLKRINSLRYNNRVSNLKIEQMTQFREVAYYNNVNVVELFQTVSFVKLNTLNDLKGLSVTINIY